MGEHLKKRTWILLRGLARESRHWGSFVADLQAHFPDDDIRPLDLPGAGIFKDVPSPMTVRATVDFLRAQIRDLKLSSDPLNLFAISFGGMVALDWMDAYPEEIERGVIVNSSSRLSPFYRRLRWESWQQFLTNVAQPDPKLREEGVLSLVVNSEEGKKKHLPHWIKIAHERSVPPKTALLQLAAAGRFCVSEKPLYEKALFLVGLGDRLVEPSCSIQLAAHFRSPLEKHPWGGHDLTIDDPEWVLQQLSK